MTVRLFAFTCGWLTGELGYLMEGGEGKVDLPIPSYLIEHPKGTMLFDTGMHPDCQHDPAGRIGPRVTQLFSFNYRPGEEISARLEALGRDPAKIDLVVNSHFHFDHVGGNALIPNATVVVQRREWEAGMDPDIAARRGFNRRDFDLGHKVTLARRRARPVRRRQRRLPADPRPHAGSPVAEGAARLGRSRAGRRFLLFLPNPARKAAAAERLRP